MNFSLHQTLLLILKAIVSWIEMIKTMPSKTRESETIAERHEWLIVVKMCL
jgi:hypothetical protein